MPRILVVDDDPMVGATIEVLLLRQGFDVTLTDGGETGLAALEAQTFDVMLVDIFMPHMRGFESIRIFHERAPAIPLIAMSGYAFASSASPSPDFLRMALELGAARCLRKPFTPETLLTTIRECLGESAPPKDQKEALDPSQRVILGAGLAVLLLITAASIGLDVKSRSDTAWVNHTVGVLKKISDLRVLIRRAESAARGYEIYRSSSFNDEFQAMHAEITPALADLKRSLRDNADQIALIEGTEPLVQRRIEIAAEAMRLRTANDGDGIAALQSKGEGRGLMDTVMGNLDRLSDGEERLLSARSQDSRRTGIVLLGIDVAGALVILLLVVMVTRESQRTQVALKSTLHETQAAKEVLEAAVAERTEHLVTAHDELRLSVTVLQSTFRSMAEAVLVIDAEGTVLLSNPAAERMLLHRTGMSLGNLRALSDVLHGDGITPLKSDELPSVRVLRGEEFEDLEMIVRPHSGNNARHLMISGRPMRDGQGNISGAVLVYHDATSSRETERQLHQSQKLDAIGKLTGGVAHDFNNMLTVISGNTETLVASLKEQPELQRTARLIDDAAERCAELIQHLLAFARKQPLQPRDVEINAAIADIAKLLRPTLGEQIQIETALQQGPMTSHIDPSRLTNAVLNMAINARDAMPNGGKLLLETHRVVLDEAYAQANPDVSPGPYVMFAVSDTGTGMPQRVQEKAFEPFFTTKEVGKGSGLGLSMVYGFVKQSGGHIKIYSEEGHGTTIKLYLPPGQGMAETSAASAPQAEGGAETIFVVEDDNLVRNFVTAQLQSLGYKTVAAADSKAALQLIEAGQAFDLLFTDVVIPGGMSGRELADEIARRRPGVKVLYTSGYTDNAIVHHGKLDDGVMLLTKPYRRNQLAEMIRKALNSGGMRTG